MPPGQIQVVLTLDAAQFASAISRAQGQVSALGRVASGSSSSMAGLKSSMSGMLNTAFQLTTTISLMRGAIQNLYAVTGQWAAGIIKTNAELERATYLMKNFSTAPTGAERWKEAQENLSWVMEFSKTAPFSLKGLLDTYVRLKSVGIDPATGGMRAFTDAVAASGKGEAELGRAMLAVQQIMSKGTLSMEEIRQQLAEAIPRAMELAARSMNMSSAQFNEAVAKGMIKSKEFISRFQRELYVTYSGAGQQLMQSLNGQLSVLSTNWRKFQQEIGQAQGSGGNTFLQETINAVSYLNDVLQSTDAKEFAKDLGASLANTIVYLRQLAEWVRENKTLVAELGKALALAIGGATVMNMVFGLTGALRSLGDMTNKASSALVAKAAAVTTAGTAATAYTAVISRLGTVAGITTTAIRVLTFAINAITVGGAVIAGLYVLINTFLTLRSAARAAWAEVGKSRNATPEDVAVMTKSQSATKTALDMKAEELRKANEVVNKGKTPQQNWWPGVTDAAYNSAVARRDKLQKQYDELNKTFLEQDEKLKAAKIQVAKETTSRVTEIYMQGVNDRIEGERVAYDKSAKANFDIINNSKDPKQVQAATKALEQGRIAVFDNNLKILNEELTKAQNKAAEMRKAGNEQDAIAYDKAGAKITEQIVQQNEARQAQVATTAEALRPPKGGGGGGRKSTKGGGSGGGDSTALPSGERKFQTASIRELATRAGLQAELDGRSSTAARLIEQYEQGMFDDGNKRPSRERLEEMIRVAEETDKLRERVEEKHRVDNAARQAEEAMADSYNESAIQLEQYEKILQDVTAVRDDELDKFDQDQAKRLDAIRATGNAERIESQKQLAIGERVNFARKLSADRTIDLADETKELTRSLKDESTQAREVYEEDVRRAEALLLLNDLTEEQRVRAEAVLAAYKKARKDRYDRDTEGQIAKQFRDWGNYWDNLEAAGASWIDNLSNGLAEFSSTGKMNFKDFANSVINDMNRIAIQASMSGIFNVLKKGFMEDGWGGSFISSLLGGKTGSTAPTNVTFDSSILNGLGMTNFMVPKAHTGGMIREITQMQRVSAGVFANAQRFHGGRLGLKPHEMPAIIDDRESILTPGQMRALGKQNAPNVHVNIINQTQQPVSAQSGQPRIELDKMVLDVVLKAAGQPGSFREGMKGAFGL